MLPDKRILVLTKADDTLCTEACNLVRKLSCNVVVHAGAWGQKLPVELREWDGDVIISFLSRWIVPTWLLDKAELAVNYHPGPPSYPGFGCYNFALYNEETEYGATCHVMAPKVDTGKIMAVHRFPVTAGDTVDSLQKKTHKALFDLFVATIGSIARGQELLCDESWTRKPYTKAELDKLSIISADMDESEVNKRIRAVTIGRFKPYVVIHGHKFELTDTSSA